MAKKKPLGFKRIGRITVVKEVTGGWLCKCDCGKEWVVPGFNLRTGRVKSCGCYNHDKAKLQGTHRKSRSRAYKIWAGMIQRCRNPKNPSYYLYGGRGIRVHKPWLRFEKFYADVGDPPPGTTIDRKNTNGHYVPRNVRWASSLQQGRNTRRNRIVEINGVKKPLSEWCALRGLKYDTVMKRLKRGWTEIRALTEEVD
jgi:hypothetical protein